MHTMESILVAELERELLGVVLQPGSSAYNDEIANFNTAVVHTPAAVVLARNAGDIAAAVRVAAKTGFGVAVKCTGHGAHAADGSTLMISTRLLTELHIDPVARTATVGPGVLWHHVLQAAAEFGLGAPSGSSPAAGAIGFTLGGGLSPIARTIGFAADLVRSFEMVTADGQLSRIDEHSGGDLFWALRGSGGGSYGIVTEMVIDLPPIPTVYGGGIFFDVADARTVLTAWKSWTETVPESVSTSVALLHLPPLPSLPDALRGRTCVHLRYAHVGSSELGEELLAPMRAIADPIIDTVSEMPATELASIHMDPVDPLPVCERGLLLTAMSDNTIEAVLSAVDLPVAVVEMRLMGGALDRQTRRSPSAVGGRGSAINVYLIGIAEPSIAESLPRVLDQLIERFEPDSDGRAFLNLAGTGPMDKVRAGWSSEELERLEFVRRAVDPDGVFAPAARW